MFLNEVKWDDFDGELGPGVIGEMETLAWWLCDPTATPQDMKTDKCSKWHAKPENKLLRRLRFAPSLLIRSELEILHGGSSPRFALRYNFHKNRGFVNLRRLKQFEKVLRNSHPAGLLPFPTNSEPHWERTTVEDLKVSRAPSVAESLLVPPDKYSMAYFHILSGEISHLFGEDKPQSPESRIIGTPYLRTPIFGMGLCAQACCFTATLLLHEYASQILGLGEMTAATADPSKKFLPVEGLSQTEMTRYFTLSGLKSIWQVRSIATSIEAAESTLNECLYGYISSGMPVIACVDWTKLPSGPLFGIESEHHAITIVGCNKWNHLRPWRLKEGQRIEVKPSYVYQDSSFMPFTEIQAAQLVRAGFNDKQFKTDTTRTATDASPELLPVTPAEVMIPLMDWREEASAKWGLGLIHASRRPMVNVFQQYNCRKDKRMFYLTRLSDDRLVGRLLEFFTIHQVDAIGRAVEELQDSYRSFDWVKTDSHWVWIELGVLEGTDGTKVIKIWDAEADPVLLQDSPAKVFKGVLSQTASSAWEWNWNPCLLTGIPMAAPVTGRGIDISIDGLPNANDNVHASGGVISPSIITSFEFRGSDEVATYLPRDAKYIEYYASMHWDLLKYFKSEYETYPSALLVFAHCANTADPRESAAFFAEKLRRDLEQNGREIIGIATFLPELTSENPNSRNLAMNAVKFLVLVAGELRKPNAPFVIELVAGSRVHSVAKYLQRRRGRKDELRFLFEVSSPAEHDPIEYGNRVSKFFGDFRVIADLAAKHNIFCAFELEPGPLFQLNNFQSLNIFCEKIESAGASVKQTVGINVDIPHWAFLARPNIAVELVKNNSIIKNRIIHAHISDHVFGHLSDLHLECMHFRQHFQPWIDLLKERAQTESGPLAPPFSGFVSIEHEACKYPEQLRHSFECLQAWL